MANQPGLPPERSRRLLRDLAEMLGCAIEDFFGTDSAEDLTMTEELLSLWLSIEDAGARRRILDCARAVKAAEIARPRA